MSHLKGKIDPDDLAKLEGHAAIIAQHQNIDFREAKRKLHDKYEQSMRNAYNAGKIDTNKALEEMENFIKKETS